MLTTNSNRSVQVVAVNLSNNPLSNFFHFQQGWDCLGIHTRDGIVDYRRLYIWNIKWVQWIPVVGHWRHPLDSQRVCWLANGYPTQRWMVNVGMVDGRSMRVQRTVGYSMETVDHPMEIDVTLKSKLL